MSTHFRPRPVPPPTPTSPTRPSTAHSTIRAITPSPPNSSDGTFAFPRPKSEHALGSPELSNFRQYVVKAETGGFSNPPEANGMKLQRGGIASGRSSPIKSGRNSPIKSGRSSPVKSGRSSPIKSGRSTPANPRSPSPHKATLSILEGSGLSASPAPYDSPILSPTTNQDSDPGTPPDTPTPMTRAQKRQAYAPLGTATTFTITQATPTKAIGNTDPATLAQQDQPGNRISSVLSTASRRSIFSTPGRDELERKKALVESDEGPFAKAKNMGDLKVERMRLGSAVEERDGEGGKEKKGKKWGCGMCAVM